MDFLLPPATPGAAAAVFGGSRLLEVVLVGDRDSYGAPMTDAVVFEAASLSKPVFARLVLEHALRGNLDLDAPFLTLDDLRDRDIAPEVATITPAMVLTHTTGLPNWRMHGSVLSFESPPGTPGYSGEAFELLLTVMSRAFDVASELDASLVDFGMSRSSFVWQNEFEPDTAIGHDAAGVAFGKDHPLAARAAGSLHTTAREYATFVEASVWPTSHNEARMHSMTVTPASDGSMRTYLWAYTPTAEGPVLWQHGDNPGFKHLAVLRPQAGDGVVVFTNGDNGWDLVREVAGEFELRLW